MNTCMHPGTLEGTQEQASRMHIHADTRTQVLLSTAAKDVLNNRDEAMVSILEIREAKARIARDLHKAQQDLDPSGPPKAKSAFALFKETMTLDKPEDVVKKLEAQKAECEAAATRAEKR